MARNKDKQGAPVPKPSKNATPSARYKKLAVDVDKTLNDAERAALETLGKNGWQVMLQPRVENSSTEHAVRSWQSKGLYRIGLVKDRIRR